MFRYIVLGALFFILSPGNFLTLPRGGSKRTVALAHAAVFVVAYYLSEKLAEMLMVKEVEGFQYSHRFNNPSSKSVTGAWQKKWNYLAGECERIKELKDLEYQTNGDNSELFKQLDIDQGKACDNANTVKNRLNDRGVTW
jgi:hypothetical protein